MENVGADGEGGVAQVKIHGGGGVRSRIDAMFFVHCRWKSIKFAIEISHLMPRVVLFNELCSPNHQTVIRKTTARFGWNKCLEILAFLVLF
jgi:hypothetical protein